jgi:hypothetical protein
MPSEHEPIDAHVEGGRVQVDVPAASPAPQAQRPRVAGGGFGCLLLPALLGLWTLGMGLWQLTWWSTLSPAAKFQAVILTVFGLSVTMGVGAAIWLVLRLRRLFSNMQRDALSVIEQMKYMATMGRSGAAGAERRPVENEAEGREVLPQLGEGPAIEPETQAVSESSQEEMDAAEDRESEVREPEEGGPQDVDRPDERGWRDGGDGGKWRTGRDE